MSKEALDRCAAYFRENPAFSRILLALRRKYESYGSPAGWITIPDASPEECAALSGLFGESFSPPVRFRTERFESALQSTVFQGVSLKELLEAVFGQEIRTKRQRRDALEERYRALLRETPADGETSRKWLESLARGQGNADRTLRQALERDEASARLALVRACQSMDWLERRQGPPVRLAVLSANAVSDPHALDRGTLSGNLFLSLLRFRSGGSPLADAESGETEQTDILYCDNGILRDSISSCVSQVGLILRDEEGEHPAYAAFRARHEICTLTLANMAKLRSAVSPSGRAYLVENEMVFTQLCDDAERFHSPLVCTSGQLTTAAVRLLDLLAASGMTLFYAGDFDGNGISIAARLVRRYSGKLRLWHMEKSDYLRCRTDVKLTEDSARLLKHCAGLEELASDVAADGHAGYQEHLIPLLYADLVETG